ncbi:MAG TPA: hypothetical protein VE961_00975 [Pyrinomonadaceae bacterium]|nr:hypothetical protein [Pyrinomonadaceae bacterium]
MNTRQIRLALLIVIVIVSIAALGFFAHIPREVFWPYFAMIVAFICGGLAVRKETAQPGWPQKLLALGPFFFAVPLAGFAAEHFVFNAAMVPMIPSWIPGRPVWLYLTGAALIAAAASIFLKRQVALSGTLLGIMILSFVVILHIPKVVANPRDRFAWAVAVRDFCFATAAFLLAAGHIRKRSGFTRDRIIFIAALIIGATLLFFSFEHFRHPEFLPGVPLRKVTPAYIPLPSFWGYATGLGLALGGIGIVTRWRSRQAAWGMGLLYAVLVLLIYLPVMLVSWFGSGSRIEGLNFFLDTLMFGGVVVILAGALRSTKEV